MKSIIRFRAVVAAVAFGVVAFVGGSPSAFALSPPWYILQAKYKATLEGDRCVKVDSLKPIKDGYLLDIEVCKDVKAKALSTLLTKIVNFGNVNVEVEVLDSQHHLVPPGTIPTNPDQLADLIQAALCYNIYFVQIDPGNAINVFFVEFTKTVTQYFADNLADAYRNINQVTADAFNEVFGFTSIPGISIGVSTSVDDPDKKRR